MCRNNDIFFLALGALFVHFSRVRAPQKRKNDFTEIFLKFSLSEKSNDFLVYEICFMFCLFVLSKFDGAVSFRRVVSLDDMTSCCFLLPSCYGKVVLMLRAVGRLRRSSKIKNQASGVG